MRGTTAPAGVFDAPVRLELKMSGLMRLLRFVWLRRGDFLVIWLRHDEHANAIFVEFFTNGRGLVARFVRLRRSATNLHTWLGVVWRGLAWLGLGLGWAVSGRWVGGWVDGWVNKWVDGLGPLGTPQTCLRCSVGLEYPMPHANLSPLSHVCIIPASRGKCG